MHLWSLSRHTTFLVTHRNNNKNNNNKKLAREQNLHVSALSQLMRVRPPVFPPAAFKLLCISKSTRAWAMRLLLSSHINTVCKGKIALGM